LQSTNPRRLRIGIDGRAFTSPAPGIRRYVEGLVPALLALADAPDIVVLGGPPDAAPPHLERVAERAHPPTNAGWTLVGLPRAAAGARLDVLHAPAYTAPFWSPAPVVLTIHDISYERNPAWYPYRRDWLRRAFYRLSAHAADHIMATSSFSASEIAEMYGLDAGRVTVVPLGVSRDFAALREGLPCALPAEVTTPFLLHVGDIHERRNLSVAVTAMLEARRHFGALPALSLVLAGTDRGTGDALCALAADAGVPEAVVRLGRVEEPLLHSLYRCATAFVYPSRYEGFGFPVLEAMACGTPVIASRAASIPELTGDAAILLDPDDDQGWTDAVMRIVTDDELRSELATRGVARAGLFTWARTARATMDVYQMVSRRRGESASAEAVTHP
jgi:glycosyltransferase involved in cell wall biosynthesis